MHPIAFQLGPFTVHWYGVMIGLGFIAGLWTASRRAPLAGVHSEKVFDIGPWILVGAIVGARLFFVVTFWQEQFADDPFPEVFMIHHGGLVFYGGLIGAVVTAVVYMRLRKLPMFTVGDILAPSIALGHAFGRTGCFFNGCCYGKVSSLPWAVHFPYGNESYPHGVHPTQIYEALLDLAFYFGLAWLFRRRKFEGQVFASYLVGYAFLRSFVEMFRGDYPANQLLLGGWVTPAQVVSFFILVAGLVLFWLLPRSAPHAAKPG